MSKQIAALLMVVTIAIPGLTFGATNSGIKPGSFFYFLDTAFEKISLLFTFYPESKVRKALKYANERLAEIEATSAGEDLAAMKTAVAGYERDIIIATEKSKEVKDAQKAFGLFNLINESSLNQQGVLSGISAKASDEARGVIAGAIEAVKIGREEAQKQISEFEAGDKQSSREIVNPKIPESAFQKRLKSDPEFKGVYGRLNPEDKARAENLRIENRPISPLEGLPSNVFPIFEAPPSDLVLPKCLSSGVVCGVNGKTYVNACLPEQAKIAISHNGSCEANRVGY